MKILSKPLYIIKYIKKFEKLFTKNSTFAIIKLSSINKGELYMEYGKTNENATYLKACENVKKIANAIKTIKMKYYTNFAKITVEDKKVYNLLEENLDKISEENNLNGLKNALMKEISDKYDKKELKDEDRDPHLVDSRLLACYGNVDVQQKALECGKIGQARKCQQILEKYLDEIDIESYRELVNNYKREKFAELAMERVAIEEKNQEYMDFMKECFDKGNAKSRKKTSDKIEEARIKSQTIFDSVKKEEVQKEELEPQLG